MKQSFQSAFTRPWVESPEEHKLDTVTYAHKANIYKAEQKDQKFKVIPGTERFQDQLGISSLKKNKK